MPASDPDGPPVPSVHDLAMTFTTSDAFIHALRLVSSCVPVRSRRTF